MSRIVSSLLSVTSIALLINGINYAKHIFVAETFGATHITDAFFSSYIVVILSLQLFNNAFSTLIVPVFADLRENKGIEASWKFISNLLNLTVGSSFLLSIIVFIFSDKIITALSPGFDISQRQIAIRLLQMMSFMIVLNSVNGLLFGILHSFRKFISKELTILIASILNLLTLLFFYRSTGIYSLALGLIFSTLLQLFVLFFLCFKTGFNYRFCIDFKDAGLHKFLKSSVFIAIGSIVGFVAPVADRILSSKLAAGSLSSLDYGEKIVNIYLAAIIAPLSTILLTSFSELVSSKKRSELINLLNRSITTVSFIIFPLTAILFMLAHPIVTLIFQRGAFDELAVQKTAVSVQYYSAWLLVTGIGGIASRVFYAHQVVLKPILVGIAGVVISIFIKVTLVNTMSQGGLALANSISTTFKAIVFIYLIKKMYNEFPVFKFIKTHSRFLVLAIATGFVSNLVFKNLFLNSFYDSSILVKIINLSLATSSGMALYLFLSFCIQPQVFTEFFQIAFTLIKIPANVQRHIISFPNAVLKKFSLDAKNTRSRKNQ